MNRNAIRWAIRGVGMVAGAVAVPAAIGALGLWGWLIGLPLSVVAGYHLGRFESEADYWEGRL